MNIVNLLFGQTQSTEKRDFSFAPDAMPQGSGWWNSGASTTGINVSKTEIKGIPTAYRCINLLSQTLACLPLDVFKNIGEKRKKATGENIYYLLHNKPNRYMTSMTFIKAMMSTAALNGNAYAQIIRDNGGRPVEILPLLTDRVTPFIKNNQDLFYRYQSNDKTLELSPYQILHIKGYTEDGITGISPIAVARKAFEYGLCIDSHGLNTLANGAGIKGVLRYPGALTKDKADLLRSQWTELYSGVANTGATAILEGGMDWKEVSMNLIDAQFIEQKKLSAKDICMIFGVPPHLIGDLERATFSNIEHQDLQFLKYTMLTWIKNFEQEINDKLFGLDAKYFCEFNVNGFARADQQGRYAAYNIGIQSGFMTRNQAREFENWDTLDGLDDPLMPLNMTPVGEKPAEPTKVEPTPVEDTPDDVLLNSNSSIFKPIFEEIYNRSLTRETNIKRSLNTQESINEFQEQHKEFLLRIFKNSVIAFAWQENKNSSKLNTKNRALESLELWSFNYVNGKYLGINPVDQLIELIQTNINKE